MKRVLMAFVLLVGVIAPAAAWSPLAIGDEPEATAIETGSLTWGVRSSFRSYSGGGKVSEGAEHVDPSKPETSTFRWPLVSGSYDPATGSTIAQFAGKVHFQSHCSETDSTQCALDMTVSNPRVELTPQGSTLFADVVSRELHGAGDLIVYDDVEFAALDLTGNEPAIAEGKTAWTGISTNLTAAGYPAFAGFYAIGAQLDPVEFSYTGPGGVPVPDEEVWDVPGTLRFDQTSVSSETDGVVDWGFDPIDDLLRVWDGWTTIDTYDPTTLAQTMPGFEDPAANYTLVARGQPYEDMAGYLPAMRAFYGYSVETKALYAVPWDGEKFIPEKIAAGTDLSVAWFFTAAHPTEPYFWYTGSNSLVKVTRGGGEWQVASFPKSGVQRIQAVMPDGTVVVSLTAGGLGTFRLVEGAIVVQPIPGTASGWGEGSSVCCRAWGGPGPNGTVQLVNSAAQLYVVGPGDSGWEVKGEPTKLGDGSNTASFAVDPADGTGYFISQSGRTFVVRDGVAVANFPTPWAYSASGYVAPDGSYYQGFYNTGTTKYEIRHMVPSGITPGVTQQPQDEAVTLGLTDDSESVSFTAAGDGEPAPDVQWQTRPPGSTDWHDWEDLAGETEETLSFAATRALNGTEYRAVFDNGAGAIASEPAALKVEFAPQILVAPTDTAVTAGQGAEFKVMPAGNPYPEITWERKVDGVWRDVPVEAGDVVANGGFLRIPQTATRMDGTVFRAELANAVDAIHTDPVTLGVGVPAGEKVSFAGGSVDWGISNRWRCYVTGSVARGWVELGTGAVKIPGTTPTGSLCTGTNSATGQPWGTGGEGYRFAVEGGFYDPASQKLEIDLGGSVRFLGHTYHVPGSTAPLLDTTLSDLRIVADLELGSGYVLADALGATMEDPEPKAYDDIKLVGFDTAGLAFDPVGGVVKLDAIPTALHAEGAQVITYPAGEAMDPLGLVVTAGDPPPPPPGPPVTPTITALNVNRIGRTTALAVVSCPAAAKAPCATTTMRKLRLGLANGKADKAQRKLLRRGLPVELAATVEPGRSLAVRVKLTKEQLRLLRGLRLSGELPVGASAEAGTNLLVAVRARVG